MPAETCIKDAVKYPSEVAFLQVLTNNLDPGWPLLFKKEVPYNTIEEIILIAPIPAYIVLDGFEQEISAEDLYKCMLALSDHTEDWLSHAKILIRASMVRHATADTKPYPAIGAFLQSIPRQGR